LPAESHIIIGVYQR